MDSKYASETLLQREPSQLCGADSCNGKSPNVLSCFTFYLGSAKNSGFEEDGQQDNNLGTAPKIPQYAQASTIFTIQALLLQDALLL
eukprot:3084546-Amphidinium_carterae.1